MGLSRANVFAIILGDRALSISEMNILQKKKKSDTACYFLPAIIITKQMTDTAFD